MLPHRHVAYGRIQIVNALRTLALALTLALGLGVPAQAQTAAPPPAGLSQEQFDSLVDAISNSVSEKLKSEGTEAPAAAPAHAPAPAESKSKSKAPPAPKIVRVEPKSGPDPFAALIDGTVKVFHALPVLGTQLDRIPTLLDRQAEGGRGATTFLLLLCAVAVAAVAAEAILRFLLHGLRAKLAANAGPENGVRSIAHLVGLAVLDGLGVLAVWLICNAATGAWFTGTTGQDRLAAAVLAGIFSWRLYVLLFRVVLQPELPVARLCATDDHEAKAMYMRISVVMLVIVLMRILGQVLVAIRTPPDALGAFQVLGAVLYLAVFLWLAYRSRVAARQWFGGLGELAPLIGGLGRRWIPIAPLFFIALGATLIYGAVSGSMHVGSAMVLTLNLVVGVLIFETLMQAFVRRLDSQLAGHTPASSTPKLPDVVARCIRVAVLIGVTVLIAESWAVQVLHLVSENEWAQLTSSSRTAGATLFVAFVAWELFKYMTDPYMGPKTKDAAQAIADGDANAGPASRLSTMMPLMRRTAAVLIILVAVMVALQDFGVNITPLIAGASVFGIAISFGSQTLVKDIVSGLFYLSDDAFRVGEYIDCGKAKGTVEGFTLRSIKLRHQNGQVHTIPFGQLGQITNFSRDWITVKFNLRFARDTDIEKLRKASKKIGADIMEMPALADQILAPFKMQGVADITGNAIVVRFKFTARPGNPAAIQREAIKRMFSTFPALGFEFAKDGANVVVHTGTTSNEPGGEGLSPAPEPRPAPVNVPAAAGA